jgi:hypothetical protein
MGGGEVDFYILLGGEGGRKRYKNAFMSYD